MSKSKTVHVAYDYRTREWDTARQIGWKAAQRMAPVKTKTLCGVLTDNTRAKDLDTLAQVTCVLCLKVVAHEARGRTVGGLKRRIKNRPTPSIVGI